ncbi:MAG: hypothetical protein KTR16_00470 [Acidiferrobacterales bacterium]|nr:hypothetical protein [Acidiferrobacterales bacterium]
MTTLNYLHGQVRCGTLVVNDIDRSTDLYVNALSQKVIEQGVICSELADAWAAPDLADAKTCLLQPASYDLDASSTCLRLIQSPEHIEPIPHATTYGWCSYEISVQDVFLLAEKLNDTEFTIIGPPRRMDGISNVIPMQVVGPDQEVLYLNQILDSSAHADLARATCEVDQIFIVVLATENREAVVREYCQQFKYDHAESFDIRYTLINRAFGIDMETKHCLSVLQNGKMPVVEVDQYPAQAQQRPTPAASLPLGNAMVTLAVENLDDLPLWQPLTERPIQHQGLLYQGSRSIVVRGSSNELIELIEYQ